MKKIGEFVVLLCGLLIWQQPGECSMVLEGSVQVFAYSQEPIALEELPPPPEPPSEIAGHVGVLVSASGYVAYVHPNSPAEQAGLVKGDRIILVDGEKHAVRQISGEPGSTVNLTYKHRGVTHTVSVMRVEETTIQP